ncbi:pseudouridine synthase [Intrasporangium chromatireducens]|uniref:pseudouridine synthase n=1 Tax=Intrasporangium chromatireducens TaxID=1386088 RepID=UPI0004AFA37B|nr:pseudouridine synthase [Intrasporangium chromatireducens]
MSEHHSRSPRNQRGHGRPQPGRGQRPRTQGGDKRAGGKGPRFAGSTKPGQPTRLPDRPRTDDVDVHDPHGVRLQKLLAAAGVGSRRVCENLIAEGRVEVDGHIVTELGVRIDPKRQVVHVDGDRVNLDEERVYLAFNKPKGVVTTMNDELGRPSIADYLGNRNDRLFHVGRLDADTEGLLLLTNDGDLAHRLQHPAYGVLKTYLAQIQGPVPRDLGKRLREGVELEDGPVKVDSFRVVDSQPGKALVEVVLHEGRKHVVRRMLAETGHPVLSLVRTEVGPIRLADLRSGRTRKLGRAEVAALYKAAGL